MEVIEAGGWCKKGRTDEPKSSQTRWVDLRCEHEMAVGTPSSRTASIALQYGIALHGKKQIVVGDLRIPIEPGKIVAIIGPSGSGKTSALHTIESQFASGCMVQRIRFQKESAIIDQIAPWAPMNEALSVATCCGFSQAHLWIRPFTQLSEGEQFRARLARAVALHVRSGAVSPLLCDEFCSTLHQRVAMSISYNLRKLVRRKNLVAILALRDEQLLRDLKPDVLVKLEGCGRGSVSEMKPAIDRGVSFRRRLRIERGGRKDYHDFANMHYRATDELGFVDKVFLLRDGLGGDALGIVVYAHGPLGLSLRNKATRGQYVGKAKLLNKHFRILRRLVIHPDVRGCGLGHFLVRKTLPLVGTKYVECLAAMGEVNPVFEKAGMKRIGQYELSTQRTGALNTLRKMDVDPFAREFPLQVSRRRRVREIVATVVYDWYAATTAGGEKRVQRQSPQFLAQTFRSLIGIRPVYYLWKNECKTKAPKSRKRK